MTPPSHCSHPCCSLATMIHVTATSPSPTRDHSTLITFCLTSFKPSTTQWLQWSLQATKKAFLWSPVHDHSSLSPLGHHCMHQCKTLTRGLRPLPLTPNTGPRGHCSYSPFGSMVTSVLEGTQELKKKKKMTVCNKVRDWTEQILTPGYW
jgi:hypothetical protein